ncbi:MAG: J domain-containing protein [Clostridia bacterium]|nr:J domain-containing protein [Clostridia bacterium]
MKNYYEILEVNPKASKEIIEKAYHVLVKKYHPDLYTGAKQQYAEKKIKEINEAYHILSDEFLKEQYDNEIYNQGRSQVQGEVKTRPNSNHRAYNQQEQKSKQEQENFEARMRQHKTGSFGAIVELTKQLLHDLAKSKEKRQEIKELTKKDVLAIILTIIVVIIIGIILWFIPITNGWMRELLFENPLFNWIARIFS